MKAGVRILFTICLGAASTVLAATLSRQAATVRYVNVNSTNPVPPFTDWSTAATNIQDAVDAAVAGDEIVVTNGVYATGGRAVNEVINRVAVTKAMVVRSVNGPEFTVIKGQPPSITDTDDGQMRCVYLTNGAVLGGFTLTNGFAPMMESGAGVYCDSLDAVVTNCTIISNSVSMSWASGGGAYRGTLKYCRLVGNWAGFGGGASGSQLIDCVVTGNQAYEAGGGIDSCIALNCTLSGNASQKGAGAAWSNMTNCILSENLSSSDGGGAALRSVLNNCALIRNTADSHGGAADLSTLTHCAVIENSADHGGGTSSSTLSHCLLRDNFALYGGGADASILTNCTLLHNTAIFRGGGVFRGELNNCINFYNEAGFATGGNFDDYWGLLHDSCTTPLPSNGRGNITNAPLFVDLAAGNFRLQSNSPCINAGNNAYAPGATDADGLPRIVNGTVDMGAYEWQVPVQLTALAPPGPSGLPLSLSGETNRVYALHASSNLTAWSWLAWLTNSPGQSTYTDPLTPLPAARFYKAMPVP